MRLSCVPTIFRKEVLDTVRDRRTLISMVMVPLAAMPLLFLVLGKFVSSAEKRAGVEAATIAIRNGERLPGLLNALAAAQFKIAPASDVRRAIERKAIAAAVEPVEEGGRIEVRIYADSTRQSSEIAATRIRAALDQLKETTVRLELVRRGLPGSLLEPFSVNKVNLASETKISGMFWGSILGYFVVLLMFTGGMYPAIDMTAWEKERRTLEVFLASPAGRGEIVLGKILATTAAVSVTAVLSLVSLVVSLRYLDTGRNSDFARMAGNVPLDPHKIALVMVALAPMAVLAASLMIAIALFAKSFKEAQSYLTPLVLAIVFPVMLGSLPGLQLSPALALVPLFNVCQLVKEIFVGEFSRAAFAVTMAANFVYAGAAFFAAMQMFKNERVLFRS
jgi:sodium transport system permease protein